MTDQIFLISKDGNLVEMTSQPYDSEELLQKLLADYPNLIAGEQIDSSSPRRWLLISREMGVPGEDSGSDRWSLDHLFLDQDGIPTLVEVKRSTDSRIRREVVGQMLDYGANAIVHWPIEAIRNRFVSRCEVDGKDPEKELGQFLGGDGDEEAFWSDVKTNLQAGKVRMLFIADVIPPELKRVVEFLNSQMDPAEVLAVEIKQYVSEGLQTLVPRVLGQTAPIRWERRHWDEESFFSDIEKHCGPEVTKLARDVYDWTRSKFPQLRWGRGKKWGSFSGVLQIGGDDFRFVTVYTDGNIEIPFGGGISQIPPFDHETKREELRERLNQVPGIDIGSSAVKSWTFLQLANLTSPDSVNQLLEALGWAVEAVEKAQKDQNGKPAP